MRATPAVLALVVLLAGCGDGSPRPVPSGPSDADRLRELSSHEAGTRRRAAQWLGSLENPSPAVVHGLIQAQHDDEEAVARVALEALDRMGPSLPSVERIEAHGPFEDLGHVMVSPARLLWMRVMCEEVTLREGEVLDACWRLVDVPPVIEARVKQVQPVPGTEISDPEDRIRHAWRLIRGPEEGRDPGTADAVEDAPEKARAGDVWCRILSSGALKWRRARSCE